MNAVVETIHEGLKNDRIVKIKGFGTFKLTAVRDRESINVNTGERVMISGHDKVSFTPDAVMRDLVNKPFAQFDTVVLADGVDFEDMPEIDMEDETLADSMEEKTVQTQIEEPVSVEMPAPVQGEAKVVSMQVVSEQEPEQAEEEPMAEAAPEPVVVSEPEPVIEETEPVSEPEAIIEEVEAEMPVAEEAIEEEVVEEPVVEESVVEEPIIENPIAEESPMEEPETASAEEEPVAEPVDEQIEEPVEEPVSEESVVEEVEQSETPVAEETPIAPATSAVPVEEEQVEDEEDDDSEDEEDGNSECKKIFLIYALVVNVIVAALFFVFGYFAHSTNLLGIEREDSHAVEVPEAPVEEKPAVTPAAEKPAQVEAPAKAAEEKPAAEKKDEKPAEEKKPAVEPKKDSKPAEKQDKPSKYDSDPRVRTGAYRIVGTANTVTVKAGQTIKGLSKTYLGAGMECYVEAYNGGITEVKEGQTIKIPKLELKKKTKK